LFAATANNDNRIYADAHDAPLGASAQTTPLTL